MNWHLLSGADASISWESSRLTPLRIAAMPDVVLDVVVAGPLVGEVNLELPRQYQHQFQRRKRRRSGNRRGLSLCILLQHTVTE